MDCPVDYSGTYQVHDAVRMSCMLGEISVDVDEWTVLHHDTTVDVSSFSSSMGVLTGEVDLLTGEVIAEMPPAGSGPGCCTTEHPSNSMHPQRPLASFFRTDGRIGSARPSPSGAIPRRPIRPSNRRTCSSASTGVPERPPSDQNSGSGHCAAAHTDAP